MNQGRLYLIPVPLGHSPSDTILPAAVVAKTREIHHFVVENAKTARAVLKAMNHPIPLRDLWIEELNEHTPSGALPGFLRVMADGHDLGVMSEAGCPAVADPGSTLVELAHRNGFAVHPLVGPSSILLALMGSGMNGQCFAFNGYLPAREPDRTVTLKKLEADSKKRRSVEIFIETPYRNDAMLSACMQLNPNTRLCVACDLTTSQEWIRSQRIADWQKSGPQESIDRRPAVFLLQAG